MENAKEVIEKTIDTYNKIAPLYAKYNSNKLFQFQIAKLISFLPDKGNVLDAGCGSGRDSLYFKEEGINVISIDLSDGMIEEAKKNNVDVIKVDLLSMSFDNNEFSGVWCMATLINIPKSEAPKLIKDFHKILKPDGILYVAVKYGNTECMIEREKYNNLPLYNAFYSKEELEKLLKENDFEIIESIVSTEDDSTKWIEIFAKNIKAIIE